MLLLALICTPKIDTQDPSRCSVSNPCQACTYKCVFTHQPSYQHATKHAHHCHAHDEPRQCLSIGWGSWWLAKSTQDHCSCMKWVSFWAFNILPHICFTSQPRSPGNSLLTYFTGSQISSLLPPPPSSLSTPILSISSASIFNQLSSTEGMEGLFSAFFTHYLNASSRSLVMRTLLAHNKIPGTTWAFTASAEWADLDVKFWMALRKRIYYVGSNPITHRVLPRITMYLCDQNFRQGTDCRVMVSASQASPSSAAPQANLQQTRSVRTLLHTVPINTDKLQDTSSLYIWVSGARKWCM